VSSAGQGRSAHMGQRRRGEDHLWRVRIKAGEFFRVGARYIVAYRSGCALLTPRTSVTASTTPDATGRFSAPQRGRQQRRS
jgi:hypothetical protein